MRRARGKPDIHPWISATTATATAIPPRIGVVLQHHDVGRQRKERQRHDVADRGDEGGADRVEIPSASEGRHREHCGDSENDGGRQEPADEGYEHEVP